ncbi:MAG: hypothetical protein ACI9Y7_000706 [Dokdonia sp.]|jgi:hypothetical protein
MNTYTDKKQKNESESVAHAIPQKQTDSASTFQFVDNRQETIAQQKLQGFVNNVQQVAQLNAFERIANKSSLSTQGNQFTPSNGPIQLLRTADTFDTEIETAGGVSDNLFFKTILSSLRKFQKAGQPKSIKGRLLHNIYEGITGPTQATSTDKLKALSAIEHAAYSFLKINVGSNTIVAGNLRTLIDNLLDEVQEEHQEVIATEVSKGRVPYFRGQENMGKTALATAHENWNSIVDGTGSLGIRENTVEDASERPEGFKTESLAMIHRMMGSDSGRQLIDDVNTDAHHVEVQPRHPLSLAAGNIAAAVTETDAKATMGIGGLLTAGPQRASAIKVEPGMSDTAYKSKDAQNRNISSPAFVLFAHEMIHARHNQLGMNRKDINKGLYGTGTPLSHWSNKEEHWTIDQGSAHGDITENQIREEHGISIREGHG